MASAKNKKKEPEMTKSILSLKFEVDPTECPFREFRDHELSPDLWGLGPAACRAAILMSKTVKSHTDATWTDEQTQPLPRSVRRYLRRWIRAEDLADDRWGAEVVVFEENNGGGKMSIIDMQLTHAQVLMRSSFCRRVLSICFMLERVDELTVEHQWENFVFSLSEGWRPRCHIYSPGMKPGGGQQHRPAVSKNGCYLVRLYYLGAWRCVWVNDEVPVDATEAPLLPFSPILQTQPPKPGTRSATNMVHCSTVQLWPLLICKALLKLAAPDSKSSDDAEDLEDELMPEFDMMHALTGCLNITYSKFDPDSLWKLITEEIPLFTWDDDEVTATSTIKSKPKKPTTHTKENKEDRNRNAIATIQIEDTRDAAAYLLPGITPAHELTLLVSMARDLPLKKPQSEPEIAPWKHLRWVDWARRHGLLEVYDCPRTKFLKVNGLMKLSYAPHLLDVVSTESITRDFREEQEKTSPIKKVKHEVSSRHANGSLNQVNLQKEELREWIPFEPIYNLAMKMNIVYFPSMFEYTTAASSPPIRVTKALPNKALDIIASKCAPLYLQVDGPEEIILRIALSVLHPRIMKNCGVPVDEYLEPAYLILEKFEWFVDGHLPMAKAFVQTRGYDSVEVTFPPGRHYFRLWVHSRLDWYIMFLSQSILLLGQRDVIQGAATLECPWASKFLNNLSNAFSVWIRHNRSNNAILEIDREFYKSYQPDLEWDQKIVGYNQALLHWMFRQALQSLLKKRLPTYDFLTVCKLLRHFFLDPDFGLPPKPHLTKSLRDVIATDPCDCQISEIGDGEELEVDFLEEVTAEEKPIVISPDMMEKLLIPPTPPTISQVCDLATEELPCEIIKDEREKVIRRHEAATLLQAHWRGSRARKCLKVKVHFSHDVLKLVMDNAFGNLEALSALMNEFFGMFPGAKTAFSVASALSGVNGLMQHQDTALVTPKCKWIPYFQGVFYCHAPVKAHFTVQSSIPSSTVMVYNNDTGLPLPQAFNAHVTFDIAPNNSGYTVMGHGTLKEPKYTQFDVHWQLTILTSQDGAFHVCDNDFDRCTEHAMAGAHKFHIDEIFIPNRRNILGGLVISVTKQEAISFRACASSPELELVATLHTMSPDGAVEVISSCRGKGEIYWPFISLHSSSEANTKKNSITHPLVGEVSAAHESSARSMSKSKEKKLVIPVSGKHKSLTKMKAIVEPNVYSIQVTAPSGWPLTLDQWKRVEEIRNSEKRRDSKDAGKKPVKQPVKGKEHVLFLPISTLPIPLPDDAHVEMECSLTVGGGAVARRDDTRHLEFAAARKLWDAKDPGRNLRGAQIRNEFREEFLATESPPRSESVPTVLEESFGEDLEYHGEEEIKKDDIEKHQVPSPTAASEMTEMSEEPEEESKYLLMPDQLREKFVPLDFLPLCMKPKNDEDLVLLTHDMSEAAKQDRHARIEASLERMKELQVFNEECVLQRQRNRCRLLEELFVDATWCPELLDILEERHEAIAREQALQNMVANKKKQDQKDQKTGKEKTAREPKGKK